MSSRILSDEQFYRIFTKNYHDLTISGNAPWMTEGKTTRSIAYNPKSGVIFKGINSLMLEMSAARQGFKDSRWLSENEIRNLRLSPRYGATPTPIAYINKYSHPVDVHPSTGLPFSSTNPRQKYYFMYNVEQLKEYEILKETSISISETLLKEKTRNVISNSRTNNFVAINNHLGKMAANKAPEKTEYIAATIAQYRLSQEFGTSYRPLLSKNALQKMSTGIKPDQLLKAMYHSEIEKDRLISQNRNLENGRMRTVDRNKQQEAVMER